MYFVFGSSNVTAFILEKARIQQIGPVPRINLQTFHGWVKTGVYHSHNRSVLHTIFPLKIFKKAWIVGFS